MLRYLLLATLPALAFACNGWPVGPRAPEPVERPAPPPSVPTDNTAVADPNAANPPAYDPTIVWPDHGSLNCILRGTGSHKPGPEVVATYKVAHLDATHHTVKLEVYDVFTGGSYAYEGTIEQKVGDVGAQFLAVRINEDDFVERTGLTGCWRRIDAAFDPRVMTLTLVTASNCSDFPSGTYKGTDCQAEK